MGSLLIIGGTSPIYGQTNFTEIIKTQKTIEDTIKIKELHIKQEIPYSIIYSSLEKQCNPAIIQEAKTFTNSLKEVRITNNSPQKIKTEMEKNFTILKTIIPSIKTDNETSFCKQKYLTYSLLEYSQSIYLKWNNSTNNKTNSITTTKPKPTPPTQDTEHGSAETIEKEPEHYLTIIHQDKDLTNNRDRTFSEVTEIYLQQEIWKLFNVKLLNQKDLEILNEKIEVNYKQNCGNTHGSYHMTQNTDGSNRKLKKITLNINLCIEKNYINNFQGYISQIFIHELAHYFYYFKDPNPKVFENICREGNENRCNNSEFVSSYAMKNKEEDYAESFVHRYLENVGNGKMIVDIEHGSTEHGSAKSPSDIGLAKNQYFKSTYTT